MLRFLQDMARSAAGYLHPAHATDSHNGNSQSGGKEYIDKYCSKSPRGFTKQRYQTDVWEGIQETQQKAHRVIIERRSLVQLKALLQSCHHVAEVINIRDMFGYNLLQYAITANRVDVVKYLVLQGADLNLPICARPLHLSAKLGHTNILRVLLDCGADPDVMSCVCYPQSHILQRTMYVSDSECWSVACFGDIYALDKVHRVQFEYPLYYAIMSDSIDCVKLLMDHNGSRLSPRSFKLHTSCCFGAFHCIQYFLKLDPSELAACDHKGFYPLQYAVQWGKRTTEYLVLKGALVTVKTTYRQSLLMLFYVQSQMVMGLAETTAYLLDCGLKLMVNVVDAGGYSPLHALFTKLHRTPPKWLPRDIVDSVLNGKEHSKNSPKSTSTFHNANKSKQKTKYLAESSMALLKSDDNQAMSNIGYYGDIPLSGEEKEYLDAAVLLLHAGANTNLVSKIGNTCLHQLIRIQSQESDNVGKYSHCSLRLIYCLLSLSLDQGANPRFINNVHVTVHGSLVSSALDALISRTQELGKPLSTVDPVELHYLIKCVELLCEHGCTFSTKCASEPFQQAINKLHMLDSLRTQPRMSPSERADIATAFSAQILQLVEVLIQHGASPLNLSKLYHQLMVQYPILPSKIIKDFVLLYVHNGADPNLGGLHSSMVGGQTDHTHSVYPMLDLLNLMSSATSEHDQDKDLYELFDLLFSAMSDHASRQCLFHFLCYDSKRGDLKCQNTELLGRIELLLLTPRTLRQTCSQWIYVNMCSRKRNNVLQLPYPAVLKRLILSMQY